jgi:hypothetical protein
MSSRAEPTRATTRSRRLCLQVEEGGKIFLIERRACPALPCSFFSSSRACIQLSTLPTLPYLTLSHHSLLEMTPPSALMTLLQ